MIAEASDRFACFGGSSAVLVAGSGPAGVAPDAVLRVRRRLEDWHGRFSRFEADSEMSALNRDPRGTVPVSVVMARLVDTALQGARRTGGLVDPTLLAQLRAAGYRHSRTAPGAPPALALADALTDAPVRRPATPRGDARWRDVSVDRRAGTVTRPPGLELDLGGIAKGVFADILAVALAGHDSYALDVGGDLRIGGCNTEPRPVHIADPDPAVTTPRHTFLLQRGAVATSGIARRAWSTPEGRPAHHLLDPGRGTPAYTGLVQVTALAATGAAAEVRAKAALLAGPAAAADWLPDGGAIIDEAGGLRVIEPAAGLLRPVSGAEMAGAAGLAGMAA